MGSTPLEKRKQKRVKKKKRRMQSGKGMKAAYFPAVIHVPGQKEVRQDGSRPMKKHGKQQEVSADAVGRTRPEYGRQRREGKT